MIRIVPQTFTMESENTPAGPRLTNRSWAHSEASVDPHPQDARGSQVCFRKILVPIDFSTTSTHTLEYAVSFAERFQARVVLLHVLEPPSFPNGYLALAAAAEALNSPTIQAKGRALEKLSRKHVAGRVPCETLVRLGRIPTEVPGTARAIAADLVIIGISGESMGLGSPAECVTRHSPCPVLVVPVNGTPP